MNRGTRVQYSQLSGLDLNMFTDDELDELHSATLDVLEDAGIMVAGDGRHIEFLDGVHTELGEGDVVAMFPPMGGG